MCWVAGACYHPDVLERLAPVWIDSRQGVDEVAAAARDAGLLALDTEADSLHSYFHKVCLIQASVNGDHFLIDPLALEPKELAPLFDVLKDPGIPVMMHGADYDVRVLDRDYEAHIGGLHDSQIMAQLLGEARTGLAALLEKEMGVVLDKKYQRADWGRRPLPSGMLTYAAADTSFLVKLHHLLKSRLQELGRWSWAEEEFRRLEKVRHEPREHDPLAFERVKGVRSLRGPARDRAHGLFLWRDDTARALDIPPFKVLGNRQLLELATSPPSDLEELANVKGLGQRFCRRWGRQVLGILESPASAPPRQRSHRNHRVQLTSHQNRRLKALSSVRDQTAERLGIEAGVLCPKAVLEKLAVCSGNNLAACGLEGWRRAVLEGIFLEALGPMSEGE